MKEIENYMESDPAFAKELICSIIKNLSEFRESLPFAIASQEPKIFSGAHHKMKVSLSLIGDKHLENQVTLIRSIFQHGTNAGIDLELQKKFHRSCTNSIHQLEEYLETIVQLHANQ